MQKKLLTLAVAGALGVPGLALAQSSVEVYGTINMSLGYVKYSGTAAAPSVSKWDVANHASNYGLRGRESLGGGLTAWFQIEQNAPLERSNNIAITPASRNSAVGIQGAWGNFFIGQWTTPWADLDALWSVGTVGGWGPVTSVIGRRETTGTAPNPNCANGHIPNGTAGVVICDAVEAAGGVGHPFWRRISNAWFYQSPVFSGFQAKLGVQTNEGRSATPAAVVGASPWMWSASIQWAGMGGRARIGAAYDVHEHFTSVGEQDTGWAIKGGWNFGIVDIGVAYERTEYGCGGATPGATCAGATGDVHSTQWGLAAAFPIATGAIRASYAKQSDLEGPGFLPVNTGAKTWNIGYEHRFSKRTTAGIGFAKIDNDTGAGVAWTGLPPNSGGVVNAPAAGQDVSTWFLNMTHRF